MEHRDRSILLLLLVCLPLATEEPPLTSESFSLQAGAAMHLQINRENHSDLAAFLEGIISARSGLLKAPPPQEMSQIQRSYVDGKIDRETFSRQYGAAYWALHIHPLNLDEELFIKGFSEAMAGRLAAPDTKRFAQDRERWRVQQGQAWKAQAKLPASQDEAFYQDFCKMPGVTTTPSGLAYQILQLGTGPMIDRLRTLRCHYSGRLTNGVLFGSSAQEGAPLVFPVTSVIPGWQEGLLLMPIGSSFRFVLPPHLAYGTSSEDNRAPSGYLLFDIELLGLKLSPRETEQAQLDYYRKFVAQPNVSTTLSGLAFQVLRPAEGKRPRKGGTVRIYYTGRQVDDTVFDAVEPPSKPVEVSLDKTLPGWAEGLSLMAVGARYRFVLPPDLGYGPYQPDSSRPTGVLVFDLEMVDIR